MFANPIRRALRALHRAARTGPPYTCQACGLKWQSGRPRTCPYCGDHSPAMSPDIYAGALQLRTTVQATAATPPPRIPVPAEPDQTAATLCGRCHRVPATDSRAAWCEVCLSEASPAEYILGVHISQMDPAKVRHTGCRCPAGKYHDAPCPTLTTPRPTAGDPPTAEDHRSHS